jgi:hypothetical protein
MWKISLAILLALSFQEGNARKCQVSAQKPYLVVTHAYTLDATQIQLLNKQARLTLEAGGTVIYLSGNAEELRKRNYSRAGLKGILAFLPAAVEQHGPDHPWYKWKDRIHVVQSYTGEAKDAIDKIKSLKNGKDHANLISIGGYMGACLDHTRKDILDHVAKNAGSGKHSTLTYQTHLVADEGWKKYLALMRDPCNLAAPLPDIRSMRDILDHLATEPRKWDFVKGYLDYSYNNKAGFIFDSKGHAEAMDVGINVQIDGGEIREFRKAKPGKPTMTLRFR